MDDFPRQKLREIIALYGRTIIEDRRRLEALLADLCGEHKREINVLIGALKERVPDDLLNASAQVPLPVLLIQLSRRLQDNLGLTDEAARWAIESWAIALGVALPIQSGPVPTVSITRVEFMEQVRKYVRPVVEQVRLAWALTFDARVPFLKKLIPIIAFAYLISPISIVIGLIPIAGMLADISIFILALVIFNKIAPPDVLNEHTMRIRGVYAGKDVKIIEMPPIEKPVDQPTENSGDDSTH